MDVKGKLLQDGFEMPQKRKYLPEHVELIVDSGSPILRTRDPNLVFVDLMKSCGFSGLSESTDVQSFHTSTFVQYTGRADTELSKMATFTWQKLEPGGPFTLNIYGGLAIEPEPVYPIEYLKLPSPGVIN